MVQWNDSKYTDNDTDKHGNAPSILINMFVESNPYLLQSEQAD